MGLFYLNNNIDLKNIKKQLPPQPSKQNYIKIANWTRIVQPATEVNTSQDIADIFRYIPRAAVTVSRGQNKVQGALDGVIKNVGQAWLRPNVFVATPSSDIFVRWIDVW